MEKLLYNWSDKIILIAEDEDMNFLLLSEAFSKTGAHILRASTGIEAIELFGRYPKIDLILMDVKMPVMNGYEAGLKIREISDVPIIAQTAYAMTGEEIKSKASGCNAYVSKPLKIKEVMALVDKFINNSNIS